ncbi:MAG: hypothetical protein EZS28_027612 [Streblomastix strix]|uniref:Tyr recombinase domain-containing protein n=1 Tax=Streblomastix strix TaxID=222440 RepID=A0A5J4V3A8_9EUKA|nr:MAG: hypothetical protein EZS28_027612 [Streblomastix strix]
MLTTDASPQGWGVTLICENQTELTQHDCQSEKESEMISNAKEIKATYYGLLRFEQVFKKIRDKAILIRSDNKTAVYDIGKWKAKESLIERIMQVFYLVKRLQMQITTIHFPGKLNSTKESLSRLCRTGDYTLKDGMIQMICKTWNYMPQIDIFATQYNKLINNYVTVDLNDLGTHFHNAQNPGDGTVNEGQGSKTSIRQCGRLLSGPVADVGRDLLMRYMKMRGFSEEEVNLLFKGQRFNTVKRDFYSLALLQDWLHIERITIDEMMKKDAEVILTDVIAFHTRQNNSVASAKSHKACLTTMLSLIYKKNLASSTTSKLINKALANATIRLRRYQKIWNIQILINQWRQSKQNKYLNIYDSQVKIASLLLSICFFRLNEIVEIRLKFSNVNKTENYASLRLAPKQANAIETNEVYETDNEKLSPKLAIFEWIDRLKKQFPKGTDFLLQHNGFNKPTTTKNISLQLTKLLRELKIVGASAYSIRHSATTELAKLEQMTQIGNQQVIQAKIMKDQTRYLNKEVRQGENGVTSYYPRLLWRQGNDLLSPYLLISPMAHPKYVSQPEVKQKQGENSLEN